ncbi:hypothetical protein [Phaffia rhodozyma]|uniref:Wax synthase domain-containing protein n=1 Tax=Phaffia rhodozyma TaxID=264483 RepID=A0A0F7SFJ4_PHARH|nr:hypothetical protein [Phaffia rhodozyma]
MAFTSPLDILIPGPLSPTLSTLFLGISPLFICGLLAHLSLRESTWIIRLAIAPVQSWMLWRLMGGVAFSNPLLFWMNNVFGFLSLSLPRCLLPQPYRFKAPYTGPSFLSGYQLITNVLGDYFYPIPPYFVPSSPFPPSSHTSLSARIPQIVQYVLCYVPPVAALAIAIICIPSTVEDDFSVLRSGWLGLGFTFSAGMMVWCLLTADWCLNNWLQQAAGNGITQPRGNILNSPWRSTSVHEFWSGRWHPLLTPTIMFYKALLLPPRDHPSGLKRQLTKLGTPFLGFLTTALVHENLIYPMANTNRPSLGYLSLFFLLQPLALLLERAFLHLSGGRKVSGPAGWVWTFIWLGFTGRYLAEGHYSEARI